MHSKTWSALVNTMLEAHEAAMYEGGELRTVLMPLLREQLAALVWVRPVSPGEDAALGVAELGRLAAAASADEVILAWETDDMAALCGVSPTGPTPCLNFVRADRESHELHRFPYVAHELEPHEDGRACREAEWDEPSEPLPGAELPAPIQAALKECWSGQHDGYDDDRLTDEAHTMAAEGFTVRLTDPVE